MDDRLNKLMFYQKALKVWDDCWGDTEVLMKDLRGKEITRQLIRCVGSISANIEEGYGRGFGKEHPHFLRISRGSAREAKGWCQRSKYLLNNELIEERKSLLDEIIAMLSKSISTLEQKQRS